MTEREKEDNFDTDYETAQLTSPFNTGDIIVNQAGHEHQLSELQIDGADEQEYTVEVRENASTDVTTVRRFRETNINAGNFDNPVAEAGAGQEVAVTAATSGTSGEEYIVNVRLDERFET